MAAAAIPYVIAAVGAMYMGDQQRKAANYQGDVARANAITATQQASAAEDQQRRINRIRLGEQRASAAQSGFDSTDGSFGDLQVQSAANAELDALTTRYTGQLNSLSMENQATGLRVNASLAQTQGYVNAAGALAGGFGRYGGGPKAEPKITTTQVYGPGG